MQQAVAAFLLRDVLAEVDALAMKLCLVWFVRYYQI